MSISSSSIKLCLSISIFLTIQSHDKNTDVSNQLVQCSIRLFSLSSKMAELTSPAQRVYSYLLDHISELALAKTDEQKKQILNALYDQMMGDLLLFRILIQAHQLEKQSIPNSLITLLEQVEDQIGKQNKDLKELFIAFRKMIQPYAQSNIK